jgi:hypothetical protein
VHAGHGRADAEPDDGGLGDRCVAHPIAELAPLAPLAPVLQMTAEIVLSTLADLGRATAMQVADALRARGVIVIRGAASALGDQLAKVNGDGMTLSMISNRGVKVWPNGLPETFCTDHWRCRFLATDSSHPLQLSQVLSLLMRIGNAHFDFVKTEHLYTFDGVSGFSLGQGQ